MSLDKYTGYWRTTQYDQDVSKRGAYLCPYNWESVRDGSFWTNQVSDMSGEHPTPNDYMTANHLSRDQLLDPYRDFYEHNTLSGAVLEAFAL
ncbi:MAG UNVERIFIED_CONTAM: hypothetical protein LVQ98_04435 [Rickettsiaceae bacterium]